MLGGQATVEAQRGREEVDAGGRHHDAGQRGGQERARREERQRHQHQRGGRHQREAADGAQGQVEAPGGRRPQADASASTPVSQSRSIEVDILRQMG